MQSNTDLQETLSDHLDRISIFEALWNIHTKWTKNILIKDILTTGTANIHIGFTKVRYYNFAIPQIDIPNHLELSEIEAILNPINPKSGFYLQEDQRKTGFVEYLVRNNYKLELRESWMLYNPSTTVQYQDLFEIVEITPETFQSYYEVLIDVLSNIENAHEYLELHKNALGRNISNDVSDLDSKLYVIFDKSTNTPVSGAGMFYSEEMNFAFLHTAGTKIDHRGKGYQTELVKFRVKTAQSMGITRIYSHTEHGSQSWSNLIKAGFHQLHTGEMYVR